MDSISERLPGWTVKSLFSARCALLVAGPEAAEAPRSDASPLGAVTVDTEAEASSARGAHVDPPLVAAAGSHESEVWLGAVTMLTCWSSAALLAAAFFDGGEKSGPPTAATRCGLL